MILMTAQRCRRRQVSCRGARGLACPELGSPEALEGSKGPLANSIFLLERSRCILRLSKDRQGCEASPMVWSPQNKWNSALRLLC